LGVFGILGDGITRAAEFDEELGVGVLVLQTIREGQGRLPDSTQTLKAGEGGAGPVFLIPH